MSNCFFRVPDWLAMVFVIDLPLEQWNAEAIKRAFAAGGEVMEIYPACLVPNYFGPIKLILEVNHYLTSQARFGFLRRQASFPYLYMAPTISVRCWWELRPCVLYHHALIRTPPSAEGPPFCIPCYRDLVLPRHLDN